MATTVGELNIKLNLELSRLDAQTKAINAKIATMGKRMSGDITKAARAINTTLSTLGVGIGVGALVGFGKEILALGGKITDLSNQANISTDAFQTFAAIGRESGVTGEQIALAFTKMSSTIQDAAEGSKAAVDSLKKLNLTAAGLKALKTEEQFQLIAAQIVNATDKSAAFNAALDILGAKTAPKLREVLERLGVEGLGKLKKDFEDSLISKPDLAILDAAGDKLERIANALKVIAAQSFLKVTTPENFASAAGSAGVFNPSGRTGGLAFAQQQQAAASPSFNNFNSGSRSILPSQIAALNEAAALRQKAAEAEAGIAEINDQLERFTEFNAFIDAQSQAYYLNLIESEEAIAKQARKVREADEAWVDYADSVKDALDPMREFSAEEAKLLTLVDLGLISLKEAGAYLSKISDPGGENTFGKLANGAEQFQAQVFDIFENVGDRAAATFTEMLFTGENAFKSLATVAAKALIEMALKLAVINPLLNAVFGLGGAGVGAALPTILSSFGGARAGGGNVSGGKTYLIGEEGPELFSPGRAGSITPNHAIMAGSIGGGGDVFNFNYSIAAGVTRAEIGPILRAQEAMMIAKINDLQKRRKAA